MENITISTLINCTIDELFDFHTDTKNIKLITPSHTKVELMNYTDGFYEGKLIKLKTTRAFVPIFWIVKIEKYQRPTIIIDVAVKSPFTLWEHSHAFAQKGDMCELKDTIRYKIPFGVLGRMVAPFIKKDIQNMFEYRHKQTKMILESK